jgi:hypothetical protein
MIARFSEKRTAFAVMAVVTAVNVLVSAGYALAGLFAPASILPAGEAPTAASSLFALYAAARALPIAVFALTAIWLRSTPVLLALGGVAGFVQFLDAGIGFMHGDLEKTLGPLVLGVLQIAAIWSLSRAER